VGKISRPFSHGVPKSPTVEEAAACRVGDLEAVATDVVLCCALPCCNRYKIGCASPVRIFFGHMCSWCSWLWVVETKIDTSPCAWNLGQLCCLECLPLLCIRNQRIDTTEMASCTTMTHACIGPGTCVGTHSLFRWHCRNHNKYASIGARLNLKIIEIILRCHIESTERLC
jgi:hypothetical protein